MRVPVSHYTFAWSYLAPFQRYGDLLPENCVFFLPSLLFGAPAPYLPFGISRWS